MNRVLALSLCLAACTAAHGQRYLRLPGSIPMSPGKFELEGQIENRLQGANSVFLRTGIVTGLEANLWFDERRNNKKETYLDLSYGLLEPVLGFGPGFTISALDVTNSSRDGRRIIAMVSYLSEGADDLTKPTTVELGLGLAFTKHVSPVVGLRFPFGEKLELLGEFDGVRINAGLRILPLKNIQVGWYIRDDSQVRFTLGVKF